MIEAPFLEGEKIYLRSLTDDDIEGNWFCWFNDKEVTHYMINGSFPNSKTSFLSFLENQVSSHNNCILAICDQSSHTHIGNIGIHNIDWINGLGEYGIIIGEKKYWGQGYAKEASQLLLKHSFERLNLRKIWLGVFATSQRAIKLYTKLGFQQEACLKKEIKRNNSYIDVIRMSLFSEEWFYED